MALVMWHKYKNGTGAHISYRVADLDSYRVMTTIYAVSVTRCNQRDREQIISICSHRYSSIRLNLSFTICNSKGATIKKSLCACRCCSRDIYRNLLTIRRPKHTAIGYTSKIRRRLSNTVYVRYRDAASSTALIYRKQEIAPRLKSNSADRAIEAVLPSKRIEVLCRSVLMHSNQFGNKP